MKVLMQTIVSVVEPPNLNTHFRESICLQIIAVYVFILHSDSNWLIELTSHFIQKQNTHTHTYFNGIMSLVSRRYGPMRMWESWLFRCIFPFNNENSNWNALKRVLWDWILIFASFRFEYSIILAVVRGIKERERCRNAPVIGKQKFVVVAAVATLDILKPIHTQLQRCASCSTTEIIYTDTHTDAAQMYFALCVCVFILSNWTFRFDCRKYCDFISFFVRMKRRKKNAFTDWVMCELDGRTRSYFFSLSLLLCKCVNWIVVVAAVSRLCKTKPNSGIFLFVCLIQWAVLTDAPSFVRVVRRYLCCVYMGLCVIANTLTITWAIIRGK